MNTERCAYCGRTRGTKDQIIAWYNDGLCRCQFGNNKQEIQLAKAVRLAWKYRNESRIYQKAMNTEIDRQIPRLLLWVHRALKYRAITRRRCDVCRHYCHGGNGHNGWFGCALRDKREINADTQCPRWEHK